MPLPAHRLAPLALLLSGCTTPESRHSAPESWPIVQSGDRTLQVQTYVGIPILQKSFFWDGNGEDDTAGGKARHLWHISDDLAIGAGLTGGVFFQSGGDAYVLEGEGVGRIYLYRSADYTVFAELTGGWMQSTRPAPQDGTEWNMTFSFGPALELPLGENTGFLTGLTYHHVSNALGRDNSRNPSQNEAQLWAGIAWHF
jgi:hypothetical protein